MSITLDDIIFCFIILLPLAIFLAAARKHWVDPALKKAFKYGLVAGCLAIVIVRFIYIPTELFVCNAAAVSIGRHIDIAGDEFGMAPAALTASAVGRSFDAGSFHCPEKAFPGLA